MLNLNDAFCSKIKPLLDRVATSSDQIFWARSADFHTQFFVSPTFENIFGVECEQLYRNPLLWIESIVRKNRDYVWQKFMERQPGESDSQPFHLEYTINHPRFGLLELKETCVPIFEAGKLYAFLGATKLNERMQGKPFNDNVSELFRCFSKKSELVFWVSEIGSLKKIFLSSAFEKVWKMKIEHALQDSTFWYKTIVEEDRPLAHHFIPGSKEYSSVESSIVQYRIHRGDGELRWIKDKCFIIPDYKGKPLVFAGIAEDITEDVVREQELRLAKNQAEKANCSKSDFLALMSHELRTPLNAILGMAQILKTQQVTVEQQDQVDVIAQSGKTLLSLLNDILDINKLAFNKFTFKSEDIEVRRFTASLIEDMMSIINNKPITLSYSIEEQVPRFIVGDSQRLLQILINLITNAIKYTKEGHIKLSVSCVQKNASEATLCFTVEDSGIGIAKAKIETIFGKFRQLESVQQHKQEGVGLGLAIVKEIVEAMGGSITVNSELGVGSQFSCIISFGLEINKFSKLNSCSAQAIKENNSDSAAFKFNSPRILLVEDNKLNQKISSTLLEQLGCKVDVAENAEQALARDHAQYDLILMDIGLPDLDGFDFIDGLRTRMTKFVLANLF